MKNTWALVPRVPLVLMFRTPALVASVPSVRVVIVALSEALTTLTVILPMPPDNVRLPAASVLETVPPWTSKPSGLLAEPLRVSEATRVRVPPVRLVSSKIAWPVPLMTKAEEGALTLLASTTCRR